MLKDYQSKEKSMSDYDQEYYEFYDFQALAEEVTSKLRRMNMMQRSMRWQFDYPEWYEKFVSAMDDTKNGWMSSHC
jgi:hypothetical protein